MGETARERFHRMQQEAAGEKSTSSGEGTGPGTPGPARAAVEKAVSAARTDSIRQQLVTRAAREASQERREALAERLKKLGVVAHPSELPAADTDLADLERLCAEQERGQ
jgi:hypothetical protein